MLGRYVRTLATGAVFTLVGVGLAYAVPNSLGGPRAPGRAHIALVGAKHDGGGANDRRGSSGTGRGEAGAKAPGTRFGVNRAGLNHGAAVRAAAHCDVRGKAHGELVRSIAGDEEATVADATAACAAAVAAEADRSEGSGKPPKRATPARPAKPEKPAKPAKKPAKPAKRDQPPHPGKPESAGASSDDHGPQKVRRIGRVGRPRRPR
jgi:hypothetical protein